MNPQEQAEHDAIRRTLDSADLRVCAVMDIIISVNRQVVAGARDDDARESMRSLAMSLRVLGVTEEEFMAAGILLGTAMKAAAAAR